MFFLAISKYPHHKFPFAMSDTAHGSDLTDISMPSLLRCQSQLVLEAWESQDEASGRQSQRMAEKSREMPIDRHRTPQDLGTTLTECSIRGKRRWIILKKMNANVFRGGRGIVFLEWGRLMGLNKRKRSHRQNWEGGG